MHDETAKESKEHPIFRLSTFSLILFLCWWALLGTSKNLAFFL